MKLELQNYAGFMPNENSCIKFNNKLKSLQRYDIGQKYVILHIVVQHFSQHNLKNFEQSPYLKATSKKIMITL
jgi:hypothetical protein